MPLKWTNRSRPPSSGVMKPKPLSSLNHLTVPVAMYSPSPAFCPVVPEPLLDARNRIRASGVATGDIPAPARGSSERFRGGGDLVAIARTGGPGQPEWIAVVARDDVKVKVKDRLPRRGPARVQDVHAVDIQTVKHSPSQ